MADPLWFGPPEAVAALLETSDPSTVIANIAAWLAEAIQHELSMGLSVTNIGATLTQWIGLGGAAYGLKGSELNFLGLQPLAAHCLKHLAIGQAAVEANTIARSAVIPAVVCQTNRDVTAALHASNICGSNTPAIIANDTEYFGYFTPQNMSIGLMYASTLNMLMGAIASTPPPITPMGASPAAAASPAETVAQSAANTGLQASSGVGETAGGAASTPGDMTGQLASFLQQGQGLVSSAAGQVKDLANVPTQFVQTGSQSFSGLLQTFTGGMFSSMSQPNAAGVEAAAAEAVAEPLSVGGGVAGGAGTGGAGAVGVGYSGAGWTTFTRPASTFAPESVGGRATGLRPGGLLNAAEVHGPTTTAGMGGAAMPVSPAAAGMLGREGGDADRDKVTHARIVVDRDSQDPAARR